jgi:hypothetical protein
MLDHQLPPSKRRHAEPGHAIVGSDRGIALPPVGIRRFTGIGNADPGAAPAGALQAKVEPLLDVGMRIRAQFDAEVVQLRRVDHGDGAAIEMTGNARDDCFLLVWVEFPAVFSSGGIALASLRAHGVEGSRRAPACYHPPPFRSPGNAF